MDREDQPSIRVATLLSELPRYPSLIALQQLASALQHSDPLVRVAAVNSLPSLANESQLADLLAPLATDPIRAVRLAVAWQLAQLPLSIRSGLPVWGALQTEYEQVQSNLLERAEAHFNLAMLYQLSGRENQVEAALYDSLKRDPTFFPALTKAQQLAPDNTDYAYVLAVALHDSGEQKQARQLLGDQLTKDPANRQLRLALVSYLVGIASPEAVLLMNELRAQNPGDPAVVRR